MASQDYDSAMEISEEYEYIELAKGLFDKAAEYWYQALKLAPDNYPRARNWLRITGRVKSLDSF
jgi:tetratricopeptide (TPR) repeat protein